LLIVLAILQAEPEALAFTALLVQQELTYLPSSVLVEGSILALKRGLIGDFHELISALDAEVVPLDETIAWLARSTLFMESGGTRLVSTLETASFTQRKTFETAAVV
jgi:hypothetical protein